MDHTKIPVMGHSSGVCHIFVDRDADPDMALSVIVDAKTQYPAACNAVETILVDRMVAPSFLPRLADALKRAGVRIRGTAEALMLAGEKASTAKETHETAGYMETSGDPATGKDGEMMVPADQSPDLAEVMTEDDFDTEYNDLVISLKVTGDVTEAVDHINRFGSHHTDSILTENDETAAYFMQMVDSAGVYRNVSTRFADGYRYGFGAEVGISTGKLHARGPVGLEGLVTYKYRLTGHGHIVSDYASGKRNFHHHDL
jgi:glutamate-5-semialdehyde dehydrogenase